MSTGPGISDTGTGTKLDEDREVGAWLATTCTAPPPPTASSTRDCVSDISDLYSLCFSKTDTANSVWYLHSAVHRTYLPSTHEMRAPLAQSVSDGLFEAAPTLSVISPLIDLIVSYAVNDGTANVTHAMYSCLQLSAVLKCFVCVFLF